MKPWFLYILQSEVTGVLYTGITTDPDRRLREHNGNSNKGARFTRTGRPWRRIYLEEVGDQSAALKRELRVKAMGRHRRLKLAEAAKLKLSGTSTLPPASDPCSGSGTG